MHNKFLEEIADKLMAAHGNDFSKVLVVLPANRAKLFLKKYLHEKINGAFWAPQLMILPELVQWLSNHKISSQLNQLLVFYKAYSKAVINAEPFESFVKWAPTALNDFNDIDQYLVDSKALFVNLKNIDYVEQWSFQSDNLSSSQQNYLSFWDDLGKVYNELQLQRSASVDAFSYASLTRWLCTQPSAIAQKLEGLSVWFAGIAALTPAEEEMVKLIGLSCPTSIVWDVDSYYLNDSMNNAGTFFRNYSLRNHSKISASEHFVSLPKTIETHEATTASGTVLAAAAQLALLSPEELNRTAVVLADQSLTDPLMSALPALKVPVNIALGIPLRGHYITKWVSTLLKIKAMDQKRGVYYAEFLEWLHLSESFGVSKLEIVEIRKEISDRVIVYLKPKDCEAILVKRSSTSSWAVLFTELTQDELLLKLTYALEQQLPLNKGNAFVQTALVKLIESMNELSGIVSNYTFIKSYAAIERLWHMVANAEQIHFQGEPVHGLQILNLVETRALDFQNVLLIGANEDTLPGKDQDQTFIPWDIRHELKMPLPDDKEAMYAYSVYRLMQRASKLFFYYSSVSSDFKNTEPSRYMHQLKDELPARNTNITWSDYKQRFEDAVREKTNDSMPNDEFAKTQLDRLCSSGISPTAIAKYLKCPLDFYYRYIVGLGEAEQVEENMDASTFGSIVHDVLENFYGQFKKSFPSLEDYQTLQQDLKTHLQNAVKKIYSAEAIQGGYNELAVSIAQDMLSRFIDHEMALLKKRTEQNVTPTVVDVELKMEREVDLVKYGLTKPIKMRGKADRVDFVNGRWQIIDYKTGSVKPDDYELKPKKDTTSLFHKENSKLIQLLSYIYMKCADDVNPNNVDAAFYSFINHSRGYSFLNTMDQSHEQVMDMFENSLVQWIQEVYNCDVFEHNHDGTYCQYCPKTDN